MSYARCQNMKDTHCSGRRPTVLESLIVLGATVVILGISLLVLKKDVHIPLILSSAFAALFGMFVLKYKWCAIEEGMFHGIMMSLQACIILYIVGMLIGSWILAGVVPTMIYYGLGLLSPSIFLLATLLICSIVSLCTGTSWGTVGTVGLAIVGIGEGLGVPTGVTAGFVISGAYMGDKMSPLSDTTNLAPAVAGTDLYQHIRAMCWTTIPTYLIVIGIAIVMGMGYSSGSLDSGKVDAIRLLMLKEFNISPLGLLPPLLVLSLAVMKVPAIPGIFAGVLAGGAIAFMQGASYSAFLDVLMGGYKPILSGALVAASGNIAELKALMSANGLDSLTPELASYAGGVIAKLMGRGGLLSMNWTISLILCALSFGGILERCGYVEVFLGLFVKKIKSAAGIVGAVLVSCFVTDLITGAQYLAIALPGRMFKKVFDDMGLDPSMLSRSLEDSGTLTPVLIPWSTDGAFLMGIFGIHTFVYAPYAFLNWMNPIVAFAITFLGIGIRWKTADGGFVIAKQKPDELVLGEPQVNES